ncbi:hypothetical protein OCU04_007242 [Sclerotinia nivalis]|uniref:Uncharacterized protein n=1 Tax=Sclerotinia nivalis TaxID=352851 RepID=A0A9X0DLC0_9HELO|nr:hypothetical protein OCU04_007242 [Sclerotinia nivalis]
MTCSQQDINVNKLNITSAVLTYSLLNRSIQRHSHQVEVLTQICSHHWMFLAIRVRIGRPCKSYSVTTGVLIVEEFTITSHIKPEGVSGGCLAVLNNFLDH